MTTASNSWEQGIAHFRPPVGLLGGVRETYLDLTGRHAWMPTVVGWEVDIENRNAGGDLVRSVTGIFDEAEILHTARSDWPSGVIAEDWPEDMATADELWGTMTVSGTPYSLGSMVRLLSTDSAYRAYAALWSFSCHHFQIALITPRTTAAGGSLTLGSVYLYMRDAGDPYWYCPEFTDPNRSGTVKIWCRYPGDPDAREVMATIPSATPSPPP